jgi:hypothetical protein
MSALPPRNQTKTGEALYTVLGFEIRAFEMGTRCKGDSPKGESGSRDVCGVSFRP